MKLRTVTLMQSVTYLEGGKALAANHFSVADGFSLETDDTGRVLVSRGGKLLVRVGAANVAGDVPEPPQSLCNFPVGEGWTCVYEPGHKGDHRGGPDGLTPEEYAAKALEPAPDTSINANKPGIVMRAPADPPPPPPSGVVVNPTPERPLSRAERRAQRKG